MAIYELLSRENDLLSQMFFYANPGVLHTDYIISVKFGYKSELLPGYKS